MKIVSIILIIAGIFVCYLGHSRNNSVAGGIDTAATKVANAVAGDGHTTDATWYYVGGGVLILIGAVGLVRPGRTP